MPEIHRHQPNVESRQFTQIIFLLKIIAAVAVSLFIFNGVLGVLFLQKINSIQSSRPSVDLPSNPSAPGEPSAQAISTTVESFEITRASHVRGEFNAPVTLVVFSDFECPFCARHYKTLKQLLNDYDGKVRLVYKHFPLDFHQNAQKAAEASECAAEQGKFWEYHDKLFDNLDTGYSIEKFKSWAKELGLSVDQFNRCLDSDKYRDKVIIDYREGVDKGVTGTPTTFVNGRAVVGALPYGDFSRWIEEELKR